MAPSSQSSPGGAKDTSLKKPRACDFCRRRKTKCERDPEAKISLNPSVSDPRCKNCVFANVECKYEDNSKRKAYSNAHARYLAEKIRNMESVFLQIHPSCDLVKEFGPPIEPLEHMMTSTRKPSATVRQLLLRPRITLGSAMASGPTSLSSKSHLSVNFDTWRDIPSLASDDDSLPSSDDEYCNSRPLQIGATGDWGVSKPRFHGRSSLFSLVGLHRRIARQYKVEMEYELNDVDRITKQMSAALKLEAKLGHKSKLQGSRVLESSPLIFPHADLLAKLVDLYFYHTNNVRPLLHRPLFQNDIDMERHKSDTSFGCVVLAVCALGSRYCEDPRVLPKVLKRTQLPSPPPVTGVETLVDDLEEALVSPDLYEDAPWSTAGWKYYDRIDRFMSSDAYGATFLEAMSLSEVQTSYLLWQFLQGSANPAQGWCMVGVALRRAQDIGAHLRKRYSYVERSIEGELWKRVAGCLMLADRDAGMCGRPGFSYTEYCDMILPLEVDDEYWEMRESGPVFLEQPAGKPAIISAFIAQLKLSITSETATSRLHALAENRIPHGFFAFDMMACLEESMTKWMKSFPSHLKPEAARKDPIWNIQSTILHIRYHLLRLHIYRRFLAPEGTTVSSASTFSDVSRASSVVFQRMCTVVPSQSDAWSICVLSSRAIASLLSPVASNALAPVQVCDVPAFVSGAYFAGKFLGSIKGVKRQSHLYLDARSTESSTSDTSLACPITDNGVAFNACMDLLEVLQDRWESARTHIRTLRARRKTRTSRLRTPSEQDSPTALASSPSQASSSLASLVPTYTESYVQSQLRIGSEALQPIPISDYPPPDPWVLQDALGGTCGVDSTSPEASATRSHGTVDGLRHPPVFIPTSELPIAKDYGYNSSWIQPPVDPRFEVPSGSQSHAPLMSQVPHHPPEWKASQMPPYRNPAIHASAQPIPVGHVHHTQQFYGIHHQLSQEALPYDHQQSGYSSLLPPAEPLAEYPPFVYGHSYVQDHQHGKTYPQRASYIDSRRQYSERPS